jgi:hypothetical protein
MPVSPTHRNKVWIDLMTLSSLELDGTFVGKSRSVDGGNYPRDPPPCRHLYLYITELSDLGYTAH